VNGNKNRAWNEHTLCEQWRTSWETYANAALEKAGRQERIDHRSYEKQGVDVKPTEHIGKKRKDGRTIKIAESNSVIAQENFKKRQSKLNKIIDIVNNPKITSSPGYTKWAQSYNLQNAAKTLMYLQQNDLADIQALKDKLEKAEKQYAELIAPFQERLTVNRKLQAHIANYGRYKNGGNPDLFNAAKTAFDRLGGAIPTIIELKAAYSDIVAKQNAAFSNVRAELDTVRDAYWNITQFTGVAIQMPTVQKSTIEQIPTAQSPQPKSQQVPNVTAVFRAAPPKENFLGYADINIGEQITVLNCRVRNTDHGLTVDMPGRKSGIKNAGIEEWESFCKPKTDAMRRTINDAVAYSYNQQTKANHKLKPPAINAAEECRLPPMAVETYPIQPKSGDKVVGFARVNVADHFIINNVKLVSGSHGLFPSFPTLPNRKAPTELTDAEKLPDGREKPKVVFEFGKEVRATIEKAARDSYKKAFDKSQSQQKEGSAMSRINANAAKIRQAQAAAPADSVNVSRKANRSEER
jgi:DNA-binding cell septation regulator SpoVG